MEKFFTTGSTKGIQAIHQTKIANILLTLNNSEKIQDINLPGFNLHQLKGDLKGQWAVTVQANWRITFEFDELSKNVYIVDYKDYH